MVLNGFEFLLINNPLRAFIAVFDLGIIHHIPDWRKALAEVGRVLKPGGRFYAEEVLRDLIHGRICRALLDHPDEDRFSHEAFAAGIQQAGLRIVATKHIWNRFGWYVAEKPAVGANPTVRLGVV